MEQLYKHNLAESDSFNIVLGDVPGAESPEFLETDLERGDEIGSPSDESPYTDDPVRVYLREMGSVSLLTRQGEVSLARRMERGKLRVRRVLSRSAIVQQMVVAMHEDLCQAKVKIDNLIEISASDETSGGQKRAEAIQRFTTVAKLSANLRGMEKKIALTPSRHVHVRAELCHKLVRQKIKVSQAIRQIPFSSAKGATFGSAPKESAMNGIFRVKATRKPCSIRATCGNRKYKLRPNTISRKK